MSPAPRSPAPPRVVGAGRVAPPPPAELRCGGKYSKNPLEEAAFAAMVRRLPAVLSRTARMAWAIDRQAVLLLVGCQSAVGAGAAVQLTATAHAMRAVFGTGPVPDRILVMDHGRIAEQGSYDQLAAGGGLFADLLALSTDR
ncbi:hypothetical protein [Streptomyces sp. STR69]|uniref:hypothetical protein n=1 Tax=Streptomyces sp. STR69 TaxID=1796942 RepID=UPI0021C6CCB7|nr:hypothetical protein [Streptomyces sp. STR69]